MSVKDGTRPGSKPGDNYPGWRYIRSEGPEWEAIRKNSHASSVYENGANVAIASLEKALMACHVAHLMLHGGHVEQGTLARSGVKPSSSPAQIMAHIQGLIPKDVKLI